LALAAFDRSFDLGFGQIFPRPQFGVRPAPRRHCPNKERGDTSRRCPLAIKQDLFDKKKVLVVAKGSQLNS
jgi:hypothetical protein